MPPSLPVRTNGSVVIPRALLEQSGLGKAKTVWIERTAAGLLLRPRPGPQAETSATGGYREEEDLDEEAKGYKF